MKRCPKCQGIYQDEALNFCRGHWQIGVGYWLQQRYEEALPEYQKALSLSPNPLMLAQMGAINGLSGRRDKARQVLDELRELRGRLYVPAFTIALLYAVLGERDEVFEWLGKAREERNGELVHLRFFPALSPTSALTHGLVSCY